MTQGAEFERECERRLHVAPRPDHEISARTVTTASVALLQKGMTACNDALHRRLLYASAVE